MRRGAASPRACCRCSLPLLLLLLLSAAGAGIGATRVPLSALADGGGSGSGGASKQQHDAHGADPKPQPQPQQQQQQQQQLGQQWQTLQAELQQQQQQQQASNRSTGNASSSLKPPSAEFVTISQQERLRPPAMPSVAPGAPLSPQQQQQQASAKDFECGKPLGPCGSAIPAGVTCAKGAGWCQAGHFCGWDATTAERSRCLPLPKDCGAVGAACCPSNTDSPHTSEQDKLQRRPYCKDGGTCFFFAPVPGLNNGDIFAGNKGAYACAVIPGDCGTGPGKPCCPFSYHISTHPPLKRVGCGPDAALFCNYDWSSSSSSSSSSISANASSNSSSGIGANATSNSSSGSDGGGGGLRAAFTPGTCERQATDCGQFGRACCVFTGGAATGLQCGARWNETGRRGYCADPFDGPAGNAANAGSTGGGGGGRRKATYKELVCTPCPERASEDMARNPSKYWPC